ncbi:MULTISPECIES: non-homologous end-joining DNA ligase [unclassified Rhizobium]|uniref:non-homologous end-joining DNA ligase n=1 Tax=unclassified Rhizobium TaxID=2613769 RepID=UPI0007EA6457|nr:MULTISPECIES: non-homologous end-joining DNA ligase [unclassified Rhizobium]ANL12022.1 ATP-dependent DNA ligase protein [Rhizobium sp. N1341]
MARRTTSKPLLTDDTAPARSRPRKPRDPAQPRLLLDPMPSRVEPCLALLKSKPPKGPDWLYEVKWDGWRGAIHIEPSGVVRVLTKNGHDWSKRFPAVVEGAKQLGVASAILDGEIVCFDEQGRSDFNLLQQSLGGARGSRPVAEAAFMAFDLLYLDGHDFRNTELSVRRHLLENLIPGDTALKFSEEFDADPDDFFAAAEKHGLEGIIAKDRNSLYRSGRLGDWLKIKCVASDAFVIVGYEPSIGAYGGFGSLLLAARKAGQLVYVGSVGTGFKEREANALRKMMDKLTWKKKAPPIPYSGKRQVVWQQPTLIAEIAYRGWSADGKLRHSSYKGLREQQDDAIIFDLDSYELKKLSERS